LNGTTNDPAKPRSELGETDTRQVPIARKHYVTDGPDSRQALMSDMLMFWGGAASQHGSARWRINHGPYWNSYGEGQRIKFYGSNLAFGDGHVEWKNDVKFPKEVRTSAKFADLVKTAQLRRDIDLLWW
jgi:prepilin-type processing-associated H-X9-DG protein